MNVNSVFFENGLEPKIFESRKNIKAIIGY